MKADPRGVLTGTHFIDGDHACCEGALAAGARFAAGYPITPSTEVVERFASRVPTIGGTFIQMEDELAASITLQGAVWGGAKAFTFTSGPGFSLMMEHIGYGGILIIEQDMVRVSDLTKEVQVHNIPATPIAEELGKRMVLNSVMVGFFTAVTHLLDADAVRKAVADSVPPSFLKLNLRAFEKGLESGTTALTTTTNTADAELQVQYLPE
jgi:hypothetical protein